jgi:hypothetical protein
MANFDIFNGDADGIGALVQLRLAHPCEAMLVTGVKREVKLLERVSAQPGDELTVLDISLHENREALNRHLSAGVRLRWFDHHYSGDIPDHPNLDVSIDTSPDICTSLLVDRHLHGQFRAWAVVAAFGDNLSEPAAEAARSLALSADRLALLQELGECINYNAYGESVEDLHYPPADLYLAMRRYANPFDFIIDEPIFDALRSARAEDLSRTFDLAPEMETAGCAFYLLPSAAWSRRVAGTFANRLTREDPERAHAVATPLSDGNLLVSLRAPAERPFGADALCRKFPTGGGREAAAGINRLPAEELENFEQKFVAAFAGQSK